MMIPVHSALVLEPLARRPEVQALTIDTGEQSTALHAASNSLAKDEACALDLSPHELERRLAGDGVELRRLIGRLTPVIQLRIARLLVRHAQARQRNLAQEVEDLVQEVLLRLFENDAKVLRSWHPSRGLSLSAFVALVAERRVYSLMRSARRNPWTEEPRPQEFMDGQASEIAADRRAHSKQKLRRLLAELKAELTPLGRQMFDLLFVRDASLPDIMHLTGLTSDAIYAWRSRLRRKAIKLSRDSEVLDP